MCNTERVIKMALQEGLSLTLVITKIDRLILELKLPPADAYHKLRHTIEEVNSILSSCSPDWEKARLSPERGNVCFAACNYGFVFSLKSFASIYNDMWGMMMNVVEDESFTCSLGQAIPVDDFASRLWGEIYYDPERRTFSRKTSNHRSFVHFILDPLYKLFSQILGENTSQIQSILAELGIQFKPSCYKADSRIILRMALSNFFGNVCGFVDMCVDRIPDPLSAAKNKVIDSLRFSSDFTDDHLRLP